MVTYRKTPALSNNGGVKINDADYAEEVTANVESLWLRAVNGVLTTTGSPNAITATTDTPITTPGQVQGSLIMIPTSSNTGPTTISLDGAAAKNIVTAAGAALAAGDLTAGILYMLVFDGTSYRILNRSPSAAAQTSTPDLIIRDEKTSGTNGGTFTSGAWQTRTLNTAVRNVLSGASVDTGANTFTLPAGTYYFEAMAEVFNAQSHQIRLYNVTDNTPLEYGLSGFAGSTNAHDRALMEAVFTISSPHTYRLEHRCSTTQATNGFGVACNFGNKEVFCVERIWKTG